MFCIVLHCCPLPFILLHRLALSCIFMYCSVFFYYLGIALKLPCIVDHCCASPCTVFDRVDIPSILPLSYIVLHCLALPCIVLRWLLISCMVLHRFDISLHCSTLSSIVLSYLVFSCTVLYGLALCYIGLHCLAISFIALRWILLLCFPCIVYIVLHYLLLSRIIL